MKPINEIPEYKSVADKVAQIQTELLQLDQRREEIRIELSKPKKAADENAFETFLTTAGAYAVDAKAELREESQHLERRQEFLRNALEQGQMELNRISGRLSLNACACKEVRQRQIEAGRKQVNGIRLHLEGRAEERALRSELESAGYRTGSLPSCEFAGIDEWESRYGSSVQGWRQDIAKNYPELTKETL